MYPTDDRADGSSRRPTSTCLRPVCCRVSEPKLSTLKMPKVRKVWSVDDKLGGWNPTQKKFFSSGVMLHPLDKGRAIPRAEGIA